MLGLEIEVGVLGPVVVTTRPGGAVAVHGLSGRLLVALAVDRGRAVDDHELVERLWPDGAPTHAIASVRNQVVRLRRSFGAALVGRDRRGYRLGDGCHRLDLDHFEAIADTARCRRGDPSAAAALADEALALVRGRPFDEVADDVWAMPAVQHVRHQIETTEELWAAMAIAADPTSVDTSRLRRAAADRPHREVRWRQLVDALAAAGHRTEALRAAGDARRALAEFGLSPDGELVAAERELVGADPLPGFRRVPARRDPMVGRDAHVAAVVRPGKVVWVEGAQGSGKTLLLAEAADRFDPCRAAVLYAACPRPPAGGAGVLAAIASATSDLVAPDPAEVTAPDLASYAQPEVWPARVAERIVRRLRAAASEREVVVLVDDVQWLDPATVAATFDAISRTAEDVHWVVAGRPVDARTAGALLRGDLERAGVLRHVALGPLSTDDLVELSRLHVPGLAADARAAMAADVMAATHGNPLDAAELIVHRNRAGEPAEDGPTRLGSIVVGALAALSGDERQLVELLTVAGGPAPIAVLAGVLDRTPLDVLAMAEHLGAEGLVAPATIGTLDLRHEMVRRTLERDLTPAVALARRHELVHQLVDDDRHVVLLADQLVRGGDLVEPALAAHLDHSVAAAIDRLLFDVEYAAAARLAAAYLDVVADRPVGPDGLSARLKAATALIAVGDVARGRSTLVRVLAQARDGGDDRVLADAILAMGPLSTGRREDDAVLGDAEALLDRLPAADDARRVQLACWVAHHVLLSGDRLRATRLLDVAAAEPYGTAPGGQGLILAMRAQADTLVGPGPDAARRSLAELRRFAETYGDPIADTAERLLAGREAWATGTLDDVDTVRRRIEEMSMRMPRPDLRWWPLALAASIELAAGHVEPARAAVEAAARGGRELGVGAAAPSAMAQHLLLQLAEGSLGAAVGGLEQLAAGDSPRHAPAGGVRARLCGRRGHRRRGRGRQPPCG